METQILDAIVLDTKAKLSSTDTQLNLLDLLQSYDNYIKKNKVPIDLKTKVYKELLRWSRENLNDSSQSEETSNSNEMLNSDLEFEFRDQSTLDRDIKIQSLKFDYEKDRILENKKNITQGKCSENKTNLPDLRFDNNNENISLNSKEKPPIAKRKDHRFRKSSEKPLQNDFDFSRNEKLQVSIPEAIENNGSGRFTPNFKSRESQKSIHVLSPQIPTNLDKAERNSNLSTTNDKESFDFRQKNSESRNGNRFSDLMNSYDYNSSEEEQPRENVIDSNDRVAS